MEKLAGKLAWGNSCRETCEDKTFPEPLEKRTLRREQLAQRTCAESLAQKAVRGAHSRSSCGARVFPDFLALALRRQALMDFFS